MKKKKVRTIFTYSSYQFVDKDPVIDKLRTALKDSGMSYQEVKDGGGPTPGTLTNWFKGPTRRPTFAAANAAARAMGKEFVLQDYHVINKRRRAAKK